ncbi:MAG: M48 family metalloprotease [Deltaproteobacteria bacterium]|jgi:Zn-dependent protease with chaperone function|nr:M48 family metalloprotease [Deltaproteobacteria bacterium]
MFYSSTDFFEKQAKNRRFSVLFALAFILSMIFLFLAFYFTFRRPDNHYLGWAVGLSIVSFVLALSRARILNLKKGGSTYLPSIIKAVPLGDEGVIKSQVGQRQERVLRNIVSELAVAASTQEPDIYILPYEDVINAMASGLDRDDASIILTKGCLKYLSRNELSALLAHEFSHLVNNDTVHFTLMAGWLHGLFCLRTAAYHIFTNLPRITFLIIGLIISIIGLIGSLMAKIIQAAFSRSRERLADYTATQFTRDPASLASVLKKIGGQEPSKRNSFLRHPEFSHLFISDPKSIFDSLDLVKKLFLTHPPLEERIWALDPDWDGRYWDFETNSVDYLNELKPVPEQTLPKTVKK